MRIGEMLVRLGLLNRAQVEEILETQSSSNESFGAIAERLFQVPPEEIERAWIEQTHERATMFDADRGIDDDAKELVIRRQAWQFGIVPLRIDDGHLVAATSRTQLPRAVRFATRVLGMPAQFEIADEETLASLLAFQYPMRGMDKSMLEGKGFGKFFGREAA